MKRANHLGGIIQVSERMWGTRYSSSGEISPRASLKLSGRKKGITELGSESLKSFKATQHLFAVDQGET
jgi:hypothetical protein